MTRPPMAAGAFVRVAQRPLLVACVLAFASHGAAAQSSSAASPVSIAECPAALRTPDAHRVAAEAVSAMRVQENNLSPEDADKVFPEFQHDFNDGALMGLPGSQYQDHKAAFDHIGRGTIAICYPDVDAVLTEIEQAPIRKAQAHAQAEDEQQAAQQRAAQARRQADVDDAQRQAAATEQARQAAEEAQRSLQAEVETLGAKKQQQALADAAERARREKERLQDEAEQTAKRAAEQAQQTVQRAAEQAQQAEQQKRAAAKAREMQAEFQRKQQAEAAEQDRVEQAWVTEASKPRNLLVIAYRNYIAVRQCAASRDGYALVYIVPERLDQAKAEIKAIESGLLRKDPSIDKDAAWREANGPDRLPNPQASSTDEVTRAMGAAAVEAHAYDDQGESYCDSAAYAVDQLAKAADPAGGVVKKDF